MPGEKSLGEWVCFIFACRVAVNHDPEPAVWRKKIALLSTNKFQLCKQKPRCTVSQRVFLN